MASIESMALLMVLLVAASFALIGVFRTGRRGMSLEDYVVSRNQIGGVTALASVTASALGAWILFSPPEAGSAFGGLTAILGYCLGSAAAVLTFVFVGPRIRQIMPWGHSLNEYVRHRFAPDPANSAKSTMAGRLMYVLTVIVMLLYMFVYLAAELTAIAKALNHVLGVPLLATSLVVITAVFIYTAYGGLKATIRTDAFQFALIVPLLLICFAATVQILGGFGAAFNPVAETLPALLSLNNIGGLRFGATLIIAIIAAELFNQGNWQRVYACRSDQTVRGSFLGSSIVILPMILLSGLLGLIAAGFEISGSTAFFDLLRRLQVPNWLLAAVVLLALALVMSSLDTLLSGISAVFTGDLLRLSADHQRVLLISRVLTVVVGLPAVIIAVQGYSVLYLFFVADLLCAALLFPIVFSLYSRHQTAGNALCSSLVGIAVGVLFFPRPDFVPLFAVPGGGDLLNSFAAALVTSGAITLLWSAASKRNKSVPFNYSDLKGTQPWAIAQPPTVPSSTNLP